MARPRTERYQIIADEVGFAIIDTLSGLHHGHSIKREYATSKAKRLNDIVFMREAGIITTRVALPARNVKHKPTEAELIKQALGRRLSQKVPKVRNEPHGKCWSKFGKAKH